MQIERNKFQIGGKKRGLSEIEKTNTLKRMRYGYTFFQNRSIISIFLIIVITATVEQRAYDND